MEGSGLLVSNEKHPRRNWKSDVPESDDGMLNIKEASQKELKVGKETVDEEVYSLLKHPRRNWKYCDVE